jgi:hypothetical protein
MATNHILRPSRIYKRLYWRTYRQRCRLRRCYSRFDRRNQRLLQQPLQQVATGYITSTSAGATTITLPTGTLLGAELGATQGTVFDLYIDNTGGASTVTIAVAVNGILSTAAADTAGSFGDLTVAAGVTGVGRFTIMFSSATAYVFTRTA